MKGQAQKEATMDTVQLTVGELRNRHEERVETVARLNDLTSLDWTVAADELNRLDGTPEVAGEMCSNDSDDGLATCYLPGGDGVCPNCAIEWLTAELVSGSYISVDVLL